jgi:hypothetical protein
MIVEDAYLDIPLPICLTIEVIFPQHREITAVLMKKSWGKLRCLEVIGERSLLCLLGSC